MEYSANINGINVNAYYSDENVREVFIPLLKHLAALHYVYGGAIGKLKLQESEVSEVRWFDLNEVWDEIQTSRERFCVPKPGLAVLQDYLKERASHNDARSAFSEEVSRYEI